MALLEIPLLLAYLAITMVLYVFSPSFLAFFLRFVFRKTSPKVLSTLIGISFFVAYQYFYYPDTALGRTHTGSMDIVHGLSQEYSAGWYLQMFISSILAVVEMGIYSLLSFLGVGLADKILHRKDTNTIQENEPDLEDATNSPTPHSIP
ncbi:MAG: hypothetical protein KC994_21570 [Candidatus Omnitrophica bacterium]|nr:hypothetical protein [Candidatus Omnitrophota bacterium]